MTLTKLIKKQVGNGGKKYWKYAGFGGRVEWCGCFVWWCLKHCSEDYQYMKKSQNPFYVPSIEEWAYKHKRNIKKTKARRGDIVTFDWNGNGGGEHVGFIWSRHGDTYTCIEGNTGGGAGHVMMRTRYASQINMVIRLKKAAKSNEKPNTDKKPSTTSKDDSTAISATYKVLPAMGMNVRKEPSTHADRIAGITCGTKFHATKKNGAWVYAPDYKGWVCIGMGGEKFLKKVD